MSNFDITTIKPQDAPSSFTGDVVRVAGPLSGSVPADGRVLADGSQITSADYPELFAKLSFAQDTNPSSGALEGIIDRGVPTVPPAGFSDLLILDNDIILNRSNNFIDISEDGGSTWTQLPFTNGSGGIAYFNGLFDMKTHLIIFSQSWIFTIDLSNVTEPTQWVTSIELPGGVAGSEGQYGCMDIATGYIYGVMTGVSGATAGNPEVFRFDAWDWIKGPNASKIEYFTFAGMNSGGTDHNPNWLDVCEGYILISTFFIYSGQNGWVYTWGNADPLHVFNDSSYNGNYTIGRQFLIPGRNGQARWYLNSDSVHYRLFFSTNTSSTIVSSAVPVTNKTIMWRDGTKDEAWVLDSSGGISHINTTSRLSQRVFSGAGGISSSNTIHCSPSGIGYNTASASSSGDAVRFGAFTYNPLTHRRLPSDPGESGYHFEVVV